ncbi:phenazine biosynthesis protein phzE [Actinopolyspora lacussalsi]|nr:phenazine biosynthesis protein phzE [Actinopolyspora lacussalsi]
MTSRNSVDPLDEITGDHPPPFALLYRPDSSPGVVEIFTGEISRLAELAEIPVPECEEAPGEPRADTLVMVPFRQISERGYECLDDGEPLLAMSVEEHHRIGLPEAMRRLPDEPIHLGQESFDTDDGEYAEIVRDIVNDRIGTGEGANFVIKRSFTATLEDYTSRSALTFFRRLLEGETGAYWTFMLHTGDRTFVGATPERHISVQDGTAVLNPISGTYRYPESGPELGEIMEFLGDRKESDELCMVVDEELKMMARISHEGGRVIGPYLKEMARLAHTEYFIEGRTDSDPREILRETMFAPTVTGSPLESACRVIARHEPRGRGYYSGIVGLIGRDAQGRHLLDSSILIRTADIDATGRMSIGVGGTLVRHSDPVSEVAETRAKAAGLLNALRTESTRGFAAHPDVRATLRRRNDNLADFWLSERMGHSGEMSDLAGRSVLVIDAEDTFTAMLRHQLGSLGLHVTVRRFDETHSPGEYDLVVLGPGPGDPTDTEHPKINGLHETARELLATGKPFLAICLSHQVVGMAAGITTKRRPVPNQGTQRRIDLFGAAEVVGFYNTFAGYCAADRIDHPSWGVVDVSRDPETGEVHALCGRDFASIQFHPESVLTLDGVRIVRDLLTGLVPRRPRHHGETNLEEFQRTITTVAN